MGSSSGYKYTPEIKLKLSLIRKGKKLSLEIRKRMSTNQKLLNSIGFIRKHTLATKFKLSEIAKKRTKYPKPEIPLLIKDIVTGDLKKYKSIREAAKCLNNSTISLRVRIL